MISSRISWKLPWKILFSRLKPPWSAKAPRSKSSRSRIGLGDELLFNPFQPLTLDGRPGAQGIDPGHGFFDPLFMTDQGITQGLTPDEGDDIRRNLFIFPVLPGDLQILLGEARLIEDEFQFLEGLSGQFPGPLAYDGQGGNFVHVGDDEFPKGVEVVFRLFGIAVAAGVGFAAHPHGGR